ncbi:MAG: di-heme oxidoredictase family protein, partial [Gemmatimonadales bacterium]
MSRLYFIVLLAFVFACSDQTEPPPTPATQPESVTLEDDASGVEMELNAGGVDLEARTPLSGGATTIFREDEEAFETAAPNLSGDHLAQHEEGDEAFELAHVRGSGMKGGLGPVFDNTSCESCHLGDGRGRPPEIEGGQFTSMLFRSSISGEDPSGGPMGIPTGFGGQLQMQ